MEKPSYKLVGAPCGHHGQYTFYKALRLTGSLERIIAIGDFFFVRIWQDSELVSIGELQLLWTDRVSDQTLVSLRLYFLPENTPDGRGQQGQDEVLAINEKVVLRAEDLLSWVCDGGGWRWGIRAVWKEACAPPAENKLTSPLHLTKLDFSDVEKEKSTMSLDADSPGVVVFSYPRYCRYRAILARLEGIQADWLRDSLVAALGGYAAPTNNTRILYCKDTFEYPELEGHEFVCNHLAPKMKGRPRGRRRARARDRDHDPDSDRDSRSSDSDAASPSDPRIQRRVSLRIGADKPSEDDERGREKEKDEAFLLELREFYKEDVKIVHTKYNYISLRKLYSRVKSYGGYETVCRGRIWCLIYEGKQAPRAKKLYERYLLPMENHQRRQNSRFLPKINGKIDDKTIATIDVTESPLRDIDKPIDKADKRLRTPSPKDKIILDNETGEILKDEINVTSKPAEELNREFLEAISKQKETEEREEKETVKISVKPVEKLIEKDDKGFLNELTQKLHLGNTDTTILKELSDAQSSVASNALTSLSSLSEKYAVNGHSSVPALGIDQQKSRPVGRSSLRAVRVKPTRPQLPSSTPPQSSVTEASPPPPAPLTNFGIHHPPAPPKQVPLKTTSHSDDEIVEVPYIPKTPEIIDLDEYPESPQGVKKRKLDILKERGLEVTAIPPAPIWPQVLATPIAPLINPTPVILNPAVQHQIMTQAQLFQMYNIIPPNYNNGAVPPRVIQATSAFGTSGPEKTVYGNPKDPFMPPPHVLQGTPIKPQRSIQVTGPTPQDILDLTCKSLSPPPQKPAVEIVRLPPQSPSKTPTPQNLSKNYTLVDGKAVVGSNLEITLVNPKTPTPPKRPPQKRSSNGKFISTKTPTPPKDYTKPFPPPSPSGVKKPPIVVPNYQISRDDVSPTSSTGSKESQNSVQNNLANVFKGQNLTQMMDMQKNVPLTPFMDPMYMNAFYSSLGQMDQRQLALYRDFMANQFRGYSGLLNIGTPTTKN
ncbi:AT-rich interactive domain-containing protein 5B-like isoform X1 [Pieris rapae]|uniref:AT-rich interactive domain-containing protein 5B-like isoform X1 n=1 Tax=Pieris rapae TaxID=64459 RepID=UPI001E27B5F4|nr:AT-rich interactive domain-containing protein 5B-like isoform X1 [Pieris rapae]